jgi:hypothetical protein
LENISFIYIYFFVALFATNIPLLGIYFSLPNVLIHEISHVITAKITGGKIHSISLFDDTSGVAITSSRFWIGRVLVSYAGYTGSSLSAIALFLLLSKGYYNFIIYFFIGISVVSTLLWVRNWFGFVWSVSFIAILGFMVWKHYETIMIHTSILLSSVVLVQSVTSALVIFKLSIKNRKDAGDATNLAQATFVPAVIWGLIFFVQSIAAGTYIFKQYIL